MTRGPSTTPAEVRTLGSWLADSRPIGDFSGGSKGPPRNGRKSAARSDRPRRGRFSSPLFPRPPPWCRRFRQRSSVARDGSERTGASPRSGSDRVAEPANGSSTAPTLVEPEFPSLTQESTAHRQRIVSVDRGRKTGRRHYHLAQRRECVKRGSPRIRDERSSGWVTLADGVRLRPMVEGNGSSIILYQLEPGRRFEDR